MLGSAVFEMGPLEVARSADPDLKIPEAADHRRPRISPPVIMNRPNDVRDLTSIYLCSKQLPSSPPLLPGELSASGAYSRSSSPWGCRLCLSGHRRGASHSGQQVALDARRKLAPSTRLALSGAKIKGPLDHAAQRLS